MQFCALVICLIALPSAAVAQDAVPRPVTEGLQSLAVGHCASAMTRWTAWWTRSDDATKRNQLIASCPVLDSVGGALLGYDVIKVLDVTPHLRRVYILLRYERQPLYMMLTAYAPDGTGWKVMAVNWNTDIDKVVPPNVFPPERPSK